MKKYTHFFLILLLLSFVTSTSIRDGPPPVESFNLSYNHQFAQTIQSSLSSYEKCDPSIGTLIENLKHTSKKDINIARWQLNEKYGSSSPSIYFDLLEPVDNYSRLSIDIFTLCLYANSKDECIKCIQDIQQNQQNEINSKNTNSKLLFIGSFIIFLIFFLSAIYLIVKLIRNETMNTFLKIGLILLSFFIFGIFLLGFIWRYI